jgi:gamma-glutamyltranspeptidase/glutathione hydrolase
MNRQYDAPSAHRPPTILLVCLLLLSAPFAQPAATGEAAIASPEPHATAIAARVLEDGGNAVDAAIATAFVLAVTLPDAGNIGGGGFMTLYMDGEPAFLDYRETAPAGASRNMYLDEKGDVVADASLVGHRAAGVPGTVAGLWAAHQRFGTLPWADLLAPAIALAEEGFPAPAWLVAVARETSANLDGRTNFDDYFGGLTEGQRFRQPELAATLRRIAREGTAGFYGGKTAALLLREMQRGGGLISREDLENYRPHWREPLRAPWRSFEIVTAPLPSSGGVGIIQYLRMRDMAVTQHGAFAHNSVPFIHIKAEIEKRIFADRARHLGDPDFTDAPVAALIDESYLRRRAAEVNPAEPSRTEAVSPGLEPVHTTHFSILDAQGNAVSNTYTLNLDFGSGVVVEGAGFLLNNEMDDFAVAPDQPNYYGVVGDEANAIAPGKRMLSSMAPTILLRDGSVAMVVGAMGGSTIFTTVYQTITNIVDFGMSAGQAQAATRVHHQLLPAQLITYSPTTPLPAETIGGLEAMGYAVEPHSFEFGNVQLIRVDETGRVSAASDPRFAGESRVLEVEALVPASAQRQTTLR